MAIWAVLTISVISAILLNYNFDGKFFLVFSWTEITEIVSTAQMAIYDFLRFKSDSSIHSKSL